MGRRPVEFVTSDSYLDGGTWFAVVRDQNDKIFYFGQNKNDDQRYFMGAAHFSEPGAVVVFHGSDDEAILRGFTDLMKSDGRSKIDEEIDRSQK